jgi:predicted secreted protein
VGAGASAVDLFGGIVVFVVVWWLVLFMVLPFGAAPPEEVEPGMATSAPERPRMLVKVAITTVIALALTLLIGWVIDGGFIQLREPG